MRRYRGTPQSRFEAKVNREGPVPVHLPLLGPCAIWTGGCIKGGYGSFYFDGDRVLAHRMAFFFVHGRWPEPGCLHRCDNPPCVRIEHLFEGDQRANTIDMVAKGRRRTPAPIGEINPLAKLTEESVKFIREEIVRGAKQQVLADRFGITQSAISNIVHRKAWSHIR